MIMYNSFSQSLLKKYGWTEGKGLGKSNQGITAPIKAHLKFNSHGISYKSIDSTQSDKWSNMYTTLTSNLQVSNDGSITIDRPVNNEEKLNDIGVNALYKSFIKSDVYLKDGIEVIESEKKKEKKSKKRKHSPENDEKNKKSKFDINNSEIVEVHKKKDKKKKKTELDDSESKRIIHSPEADSLNSNFSKKDKKIKSFKGEEISKTDLKEICDKPEKPKKKRSKNKETSLDKMILICPESKLSIHSPEDDSVNSNVPKKDKKKNKSFKEKEISKTDLKEICDDPEKPKKKRSKNKEASLNKMKIVIPDSTFMTCHPAARCGLGMSGKLARIQKLHDQEKLKSLI